MGKYNINKDQSRNSVTQLDKLQRYWSIFRVGIQYLSVCVSPFLRSLSEIQNVNMSSLKNNVLTSSREKERCVCYCHYTLKDINFMIPIFYIISCVLISTSTNDDRRDDDRKVGSV